MADQFEIGTTYAGLASLASLNLEDPQSTFQDYSEAFDNADGSSRAMGSPRATWHYGFMTRTQKAAFRAFCAGRSATVYIRTVNLEGYYLAYSGIMIWPENEDFKAGRMLDITFEFRQLVLIPEGD